MGVRASAKKLQNGCCAPRRDNLPPSSGTQNHMHRLETENLRQRDNRGTRQECPNARRFALFFPRSTPFAFLPPSPTSRHADETRIDHSDNLGRPSRRNQRLANGTRSPLEGLCRHVRSRPCARRPRRSNHTRGDRGRARNLPHADGRTRERGGFREFVLGRLGDAREARRQVRLPFCAQIRRSQGLVRLTCPPFLLTRA